MNADQFTAPRQQGERNCFLIDSNLLLLLAVGYTDRAQISRFDRLSAYTEPDFELLLQLVARAPRLITLPNVLTEVSNLAGKLREPLLQAFYLVLAGKIDQLDEVQAESRRASRNVYFTRLGLTDSAIILVAVETKCTVITTDLGLYLALEECGAGVINFNHLRQAAGEFSG